MECDRTGRVFWWQKISCVTVGCLSIGRRERFDFTGDSVKFTGVAGYCDIRYFPGLYVCDWGGVLLPIPIVILSKYACDVHPNFLIDGL